MKYFALAIAILFSFLGFCYAISDDIAICLLCYILASIWIVEASLIQIISKIKKKAAEGRGGK